jgi:glycine/D-amino acid oxidase-like deaminating enzyme
MVAPIKTDVAIVGAGIIGLAIAFRLAADGREVVVIDPNEPGLGASYGNAGAIAPYPVFADSLSKTRILRFFRRLSN